MLAISATGDIEREPGGGEERRVFGRGKMSDERNVRPTRGSRAGYCAPPMQKPQVSAEPCGLDKQPLERGLALGGSKFRDRRARTDNARPAPTGRCTSGST